jgi:hypothetical protein
MSAMMCSLCTFALLDSTYVLPPAMRQVLYATVLSLGFLFTGYLQWSGLTSAEVSG